MGAVARAVRAAGGHTVGVIPEALLALEVGDREADELIVTTTMRERKALMDERADGFIALAGGLGTLEELLEIWVGRVLRIHTKPVVVLDPHGLFGPLRAQVEELVRQGFARTDARDAVLWVDSVEQALDAVEAGVPLPARGGEEEIAEEIADGGVAVRPGRGGRAPVRGPRAPH
jgi:uncharacterized protein (TIGR00730 family)